jgi:hypothetical protein
MGETILPVVIIISSVTQVWTVYIHLLYSIFHSILSIAPTHAPRQSYNCITEWKMTSQQSSFAAAAVSSSVQEDNANQDLELYSPPPSSMTLVAALFLLGSPLFTITVFNKVFLLPKDYLENWLIWA